jgi:hypothetical protein
MFAFKTVSGPRQTRGQGIGQKLEFFTTIEQQDNFLSSVQKDKIGSIS